MKLYTYKDYGEYKRIQTLINNQKIRSSYVDPNTIKRLAHYIFEYNNSVKFGLCHGTRRGLEQKVFIEEFKSLGKVVKVIGTEISDTATQFPDTIEWDFHEVKDEWINNVDFIYSNSFDHSYKPEECLDVWMGCLNETGLCILEWSLSHGEDYGGKPADPFGASLLEYKDIIQKKYIIKEIIKDGVPPEGKDNRNFIVIKKNK